MYHEKQFGTVRCAERRDPTGRDAENAIILGLLVRVHFLPLRAEFDIRISVRRFLRS
jgi:hypothetical protein